MSGSPNDRDTPRGPDPWPIIEWLRENMPRALELCPYKVGGEAVSREARAVEQRRPDGGAAPVPTSPPYDTRELFIEVLAHHALVEIRCDHGDETDVAVCNCAVWASKPEPSVQAAKEAWAAHVWAALYVSDMEVCGL